MEYIRKINLINWISESEYKLEQNLISKLCSFINSSYYCINDQISADSITDSKTKNNNLSIWKLNDRNQINTILLAILFNLTSLDKVSFVILNEDEMIKAGLLLKDTKGTTPVSSLVDFHTDIISLNLKSLGLITSHIHHRLKNDDNLIQLTKPQVKKLLLEAIEKEMVDIDLINKSLKKDLGIAK